MQVIEAQRASILVPHDHLHISHESAIILGEDRVLHIGVWTVTRNAKDAAAQGSPVRSTPAGFL